MLGKTFRKDRVKRKQKEQLLILLFVNLLLHLCCLWKLLKIMKMENKIIKKKTLSTWWCKFTDANPYSAYQNNASKLSIFLQQLYYGQIGFIVFVNIFICLIYCTPRQAEPRQELMTTASDRRGSKPQSLLLIHSVKCVEVIDSHPCGNLPSLVVIRLRKSTKGYFCLRPKTKDLIMNYLCSCSC